MNFVSKIKSAIKTAEAHGVTFEGPPFFTPANNPNRAEIYIKIGIAHQTQILPVFKNDIENISEDELAKKLIQFSKN